MKAIGNMVEGINRRGLMFLNIVLLSLAMLLVNLWQTGNKIFDKSDFENVVPVASVVGNGYTDNSWNGNRSSSRAVCAGGGYATGGNGIIECSLRLAAELFGTTFQNYDIPLQVNVSSLGQNANTARSGCWQSIIRRVQPAPKKQSYAGDGFAVADSRPVKVKYIYSTCNLRI